MSLLDGGNELVTIYSQVQTVDDDGNDATAPSDVGVTVKARVFHLGWGVRASEDLRLGLSALHRYKVRIDRRRWADVPIGPWAAVEWRGTRWDVLGAPELYLGSPRTRHIVAIIRTNF